MAIRGAIMGTAPARVTPEHRPTAETREISGIPIIPVQTGTTAAQPQVIQELI